MSLQIGNRTKWYTVLYNVYNGIAENGKYRSDTTDYPGTGSSIPSVYGTDTGTTITGRTT